MLIDKRDIPEVAVDEMNKTHSNEIELVNGLYDLITKTRSGQPDEEALADAIEQFQTHVEQHFSREEQLMQETGFPAFTVHKGEHDRVRAELYGIIDAWRTTRDIEPLANYLENVHPNWAKNHIATMDSMTAYFIAQASSSSRAG